MSDNKEVKAKKEVKEVPYNDEDRLAIVNMVSRGSTLRLARATVDLKRAKKAPVSDDQREAVQAAQKKLKSAQDHNEKRTKEHNIEANKVAAAKMRSAADALEAAPEKKPAPAPAPAPQPVATPPIAKADEKKDDKKK